MAGDPKECRANALRCSELAAKTSNQPLKATLLGLAENWARLATELETAETMRDMVEDRAEGGASRPPGLELGRMRH